MQDFRFASMMSTRSVTSSEESAEAEATDSRCPICLELFSLPISLPCCRHQFCFLCIKGVALRTGKCALCRSPIPQTLLSDPDSLLSSFDSPPKSKQSQIQSTSPEKSQKPSCSSCTEDSPDVKWYYSGYKGQCEDLMNFFPVCADSMSYTGWWCYDERTTKELEKLYVKYANNTQCTDSTPTSDEEVESFGHNLPDGQFELMITGYVYVVDLKKMVQFRKNLTGRSRNMKRVSTSSEQLDLHQIKGVSGLKTLARDEITLCSLTEAMRSASLQ